MSSFQSIPKTFLAAIVFCVGVAGLVSWLHNGDDSEGEDRSDGDPPGQSTVSAPPPLPDGPFLNLGADARYVGSESCIDCHQAEADSYRLTGMGRSLARIDPAAEPPSGVVEHAASQRRYSIYRAKSQFRHQEQLRVSSLSDPVVLADHPVDWVIGSGRHSRSYLLEVDGFLVESPVTWYSQRKEWDMSPGYDSPSQGGFSRPVSEGCLYCHAGKAEVVSGSTHRMRIHETWISCERCHGPGSFHVERHTTGESRPASSKPVNSGEFDESIVNQRHLGRKLSESICSQCHLRSSATVAGRGRSLTGFRPGLPLESFRGDFRLQDQSGHMTVVGHVDQLRQSQCWNKSSLTCTTCHNPHHMLDERNRLAHHRAICLNCHSLDHCKADPPTRQQTSPADNCLACHMPTSDTEIPHLAFTHHRIGIHKPDESGPESNVSGPGKLIPINDLSGWSKLDQNRMQGLAWLEVASNKGGPLVESRRQEAFRLLSHVWDQGMHDSATASGLLALTAGSRDARIRQFIKTIQADSDCPPDFQLNGLLGQALMHADSGRLDDAVDVMKEIVTRRRVSGDWVLLAEFLDRQGNKVDCMKCLEQALQIEPLQPSLRRALIDYYKSENRLERAEWHRKCLSLPVQRHPR